MHIPDGWLAAPVWATLDVSSAVAVGIVAKRAERGLPDGTAPLLGVMGAFVFAAQMINFPVGAGTSGHLVGGALLGCTLGPAAAVIVMTAILALQALVFQDGGLLALGANVFNMALAGVLAGSLPYRYLGEGSWRRASVFLGGVLSVVASASLALAELRMSGVPMPAAVVSVSLGLFLISALAEGVITMMVFSALERMNAGWVRKGTGRPSPVRGLLAAAAVLFASVGALLASGLPDGLESFALRVGIEGSGGGILETPLQKAAAGLTGLAMIYVVCALAGRIMARKRDG